MNDWLIFAATLAVQLLMGAYVYGKLSGQVHINTQRIEDHEERIRGLEGRDR